MSNCTSYGEKKNFDGLDIYYSEDINIDKVEALGEYLVASKFTDGSEKAIKLELAGDSYELKLVILPEFIEKEEYSEQLLLFGQLLNTSVFNDSLTNLHLCDKYFETIKTLDVNANK
jgi:hypothetical protein